MNMWPNITALESVVMRLGEIQGLWDDGHLTEWELSQLMEEQKSIVTDVRDDLPN
jgi:ribonuclease PH